MARTVTKAFSAADKKRMCAEILADIACGMSVAKACEPADRCSYFSFFKWLNSDPVLAQQYARATELRAEKQAEEILDIADETALDYKKNERGELVVDQEAIARSRLRIDSRKWLMSKMLPKKYGDKVAIEGNPDSPIQHEHRVIDEKRYIELTQQVLDEY